MKKSKMNITIIGSFRKYYDDICNLIDILNENNINVLSPKKSFIVDNIDGFVMLDTDKRDQKPFIIQEHVFENIGKSSLVYVWNPEGYLGNSTCYEIGKIMSMGKMLIFKEHPKDLPIEIKEDMVKDINDMIPWLNEKRRQMESSN